MNLNNTIKRRFTIIGILLIAISGSFGLTKLKPPPDKKILEKQDPLVEVFSLVPATEFFRVSSQGSVAPRTQTILSAEVSGSIISISPKFVAGGVFVAGEELLRIDQTEYLAAVERSEAVLNQRNIEYDGAASLRTQGYRAESEYASAAAALAIAKADLVNARRNLERTSISLPYDGMIKSKQADLGQFVNRGTQLGMSFAIDYAEVRLPLTDQDIAFVDLPQAVDLKKYGSAEGPLVKLTAIQKAQEKSWQARIIRTEGVVDERNRVTYAVARIEDPYKLNSPNVNESSLPIGTFVSADIEGSVVENVVKIPRQVIRANNQVIFIDPEDRIRLHQVEIIRSDSEYAYVLASSLSEMRISLTVMELPINGMRVRTRVVEQTTTTSDGVVGQNLINKN